MPRVATNGIELEYDTFGDAGDPPLLLIMGLGAQLIWWPVPLCRQLAAKGFHVIRFDNRDAGLSSAVAEEYRIADLAEDTAGLLAELGVAPAHLVGASMGGMIAQQVAIDHPQRVRSLCSIMSTTGDRSVGAPTPEVWQLMTEPQPTDRDGIIAQAMRLQRAIGSPGFPVSDADLRAKVTAGHDRAHRPEGVARQLAAIRGSGDRTEGLRRLAVPALVVHGDDDPLVAPSGGKATADAIPGAELMAVPGMGHDLPPDIWPELVERIAATAARAG